MTAKSLSKTEDERAHSQSLTDSRLWQNLAREGKRYVEEKLLATISKHPDGMTLAEAAGSLGTVPVALAWATRSLLKRGKIRKKEMLYFPASAK